MARDHRADAERPERPDPRVALQPPRFEIGFVNRRVGDARCALRACGRGVNPASSLSNRHENFLHEVVCSRARAHPAPWPLSEPRYPVPQQGRETVQPTTPVRLLCGSGRCGFRSSAAPIRAVRRAGRGCETPGRPANRVRSCRPSAPDRASVRPRLLRAIALVCVEDEADLPGTLHVPVDRREGMDGDDGAQSCRLPARSPRRHRPRRERPRRPRAPGAALGGVEIDDCPGSSCAR